jgi:hypothetical protein
MIQRTFPLRGLFLAAILAAGVFPRPAAAATNAARAGLGGIANGTILGGDGTGSAAITVNAATLTLTKQARDVTGTVLPDGAGVGAGQDLWFVLLVDNPTAHPAGDVRILDPLDETLFTLVPGTLAECTVPSGSGDAAIWAGSWSSVTDSLGLPFSVPGGSLRALRFRVRVAGSTLPGQTLVNAATGTNGPVALDGSAAAVRLTRSGGVASQATAEILPAVVDAGTRPRLDYWAVATVGPGDAGVQALEITLPAGWTNPTVTGVEVDGVPLGQTCPTPAPGGFCPGVTGAALRIELGSRLAGSGQRLHVTFRADAPAAAGESDFAASVFAGAAALAAVPGDADGTPGNSDGIRVRTVATQGIVLDLDLLADRRDAVVGEAVTVTVPIRNLTEVAVADAVVAVALPPHFRVAGEARLDGQPVAAAVTASAARFPVGSVPARSDADGSGTLDPGEPGYRSLAFRLVAASSARPGEQEIRVRAVDTCDECDIAEAVHAALRVRDDPDFERGTVLGKVFEDLDGDGRQGPGEPGVGHARVALDDGTVADTDAHGRYSIPFVAPGLRLVKLDLASVGPGARATGEESRIVRVTPGLLAKASFGVVVPTETVSTGREEVEGVALVSLADDHGIDVLGNVGMLTVLVNGTEMAAPSVDVGVSGRAGDPLRFALRAEDAQRVRAWTLRVLDGGGGDVHRVVGRGAPPAAWTWDGHGAACRLEVEYEGDLRVGSALRPLPGAAVPPGEAAASVQRVPVGLDGYGRFSRRVADPRVDTLRVELRGADGRTLERAVPVPSIELNEATSPRIVGRDEEEVPGLLGWTDPRNAVEVDGAVIALDDRGAIVVPVDPSRERVTHAVLIRNPEGLVRIVNLNVNRSERDESGGRWLVQDRVPEMSLRLPPSEPALSAPRLRFSGRTDPGNAVTVAGREVPVEADGRFAGALDLAPGETRLVAEVRDPEGRTGRVERTYRVEERRSLFLVALADAEVGRLQGSGRLEAAGLDERTEYYHQGRLAYYLKGWVRGRVLVTSAFDSGREETNGLFADLGPEESDRLFRDLDPDRLYPVYGDAGTVTWDAESQGKFYLALEADEGHALFGNYPVAFDDTELAAYRRTLYGGQVAVRSLATAPDGEPLSRIEVFGADVTRIHVRDELAATGGSLYYLSHRDVAEGSEQVAIVVRDKTTGLLLRRSPQARGRDYDVKYPEGRLVFRRPVASVELDAAPVDDTLVQGNPVRIEVDYEAAADGFQDGSFGVRGHRRQGRVGIGATYVDDPQGSGAYELQGVDAEVGVGERSRIVAEVAGSSGADARTFRSDDGGLTFAETAADARDEGTAWKVAAELRVDDWIRRAKGLRVTAYHRDVESGFASGLGSFDRGTRRTGVTAALPLNEEQSVQVRHHRDELDGPATPTTGITSALWRLDGGRTDVAVELEDRRHRDAPNAPDADGTVVAAEVSRRLTDRLDAGVGRQQPLRGPDRDQTTLRLGYRLLERLSLDGQGVHGADGEAAQLGAVWELADGRLYVTERVQDGTAGGRRATILGAESALGPRTRIYSEHQWDRAPSGDRAISLVGAQRSWDPAAGLRFTLGAELSHVDGQSESIERSSASAGVGWKHPSGITARTRNEIRFESGAGGPRRMQYVTDNRVDLALSPDVTLLGAVRRSRTENRNDGSVAARFHETVLGMAYRRVKDDRADGLARYTRRTDRRPVGDGSPASLRRMDVMSLEGVVELVPRVQWYAKGAGRILDETDAVLGDLRTRTWLGIQRVDVTVRRPVDVGVEYRLLRQEEADDLLQGWLTEVSGKLRKRLRLGVGYNFTDFSDDEFSMNDYSVHGWFLRIQGKY